MTSVNTTAGQKAQAPAKKKAEGKLWFWPAFPKLMLGAAAIFALAMVWRWYQGWAAWEHGLDASAVAFQTYWINLLYLNIGGVAVLAIVLWSWIWITRDRHLTELSPREELRRTFTFVSFLFLYVFAVYWAGSFFAEQDASWHQVAIRDTAFTPSHIVLFYGAFPLYITIGVASFLYAITRLPYYCERMSVPLILAVVGPFLLLPNVGFNEWGHAFWLFEEVFTAPLHWGFVLFGWSALALGGVLSEVMIRLTTVVFPKLYGEDYGSKLLASLRSG
jgi:methane/ammonia monooxygenase subunit C